MRKTSLALAVVAFGAQTVLFFACSSAPEEAGDSCELDGDPCPAGTVCQANADDETICKVVLGGTCDPEADEDICENGSVCATNRDGKSECGIPEGEECDPTLEDPNCAGDNVCAELEAGGYACYPPVLVRGRVFDAETDTGIASAHVLGLDDQATAITDIALSAADGKYELDLPVARHEDGSPVDIIFTLRGSAQDYQTFPSGLRTSLPIETNTATKPDNDIGYIIQLPLTDISLIGLPEEERGQPSISGTVKADDQSAGVLVVAEGGEGIARSAISDAGGAYTIFNVPGGAYTVSGYAAGVALQPASADVAAEAVAGVDLLKADIELGSISGNIQIVNGGGASTTSVVLVVESTFSETFVRGEVPRGLRAPLSGPPTITGDFTIANVPPGKYVVLAGFENDGLVRDPDPNIAGTQILHTEMPSPGVELSAEDSFKVTGALEILSPGAEDPEPVSGNPTFSWVDDSSEDFYSIVVYDAFGNLVWENQDLPSVSGGNVSVEYAGPALEKGMYYQFRATSWRSPGGEPGPISQTEDLRGVFFAE
ncbi:MAG: carboxypeptidase regulatory-like domain-containing protein [Polyangiaceae bacterium]|nr:carboxypeptidase regulatory-like domain-containing protein [Polyangiaceae bacterium]